MTISFDETYRWFHVKNFDPSKLEDVVQQAYLDGSLKKVIICSYDTAPSFVDEDTPTGGLVGAYGFNLPAPILISSLPRGTVIFVDAPE